MRRLLYGRSEVERYANTARYLGCSVRCLRDEGCTTTNNIPTVTTANVTDITSTAAITGGNVVSDGGASVLARGVCWSTSHNPTRADSHTSDSTGIGNFTSYPQALTTNATYYVRAYALNNIGTAYGEELSFTTVEAYPCHGAATLTDIDGNIYNTVQIGTQCWMKENLRTTKYADGIPISQFESVGTEPAWRYPNGDSTNITTYGLLYNGPAAMRFEYDFVYDSTSNANDYTPGTQGICPTGWHVPTIAEWSQMRSAVGNIAAKFSGDTGWESSTVENAAGNFSASGRNSSGFSALPAGNTYDVYFGREAYFWSSTAYDRTAWDVCKLTYNTSYFYCDEYLYRNHYSSVRCVKD